MADTYTIYAIVLTQTRQTVWVGVTKRVARRRYEHRTRQSPLFPIRDFVEFQIIRTVHGLRRAKQLETQIQCALKRRGQCQLCLCPSYTLAHGPKSNTRLWRHGRNPRRFERYEQVSELANKIKSN